jgi:hypothetical protein
MAIIKILLSSEERKALFRASQFVYRSLPRWESDFADNLCDELDDGGIWDPCLIVVSNEEESDQYASSQFGLLFVLKHGKNKLEEYSHTLQMIEDRLLYVDSRSIEKSRQPVPPFLTRKDYYGPNWDEKREEAIERDDERCRECGMPRDEHRDRFGHDLHVHHLVSLREVGDYSEANELENLKTLCAQCHYRTEKAD